MILTAALILAGCEYDDSALRNELDGQKKQLEQIEKRLAALEKLTGELNDAIDENLSIVAYTELPDGAGWRITFSDGSSLDVTDGQDGKDGEDGKDGKDGKDGTNGRDGNHGDSLIESIEENPVGQFLVITLTNGTVYQFRKGPDRIDVVKIPAGTFKMGSLDSELNHQDNETLHEVTLTRTFYMGKYEVTKAQFTAFLNAVGVAGVNEYESAKHTVSGYGEQPLFTVSEYGWTPVWDADSDKWVSQSNTPETQPDDAPMIQVTWYGAKAYADWVGGALPTEAQWEYACRAGSETIYSYGDDADEDYMWYTTNSGSQTHKVGEKQPNAWGLYDMHGNVFEWCLDQWDYSNNYQTADTEGAAISDPLVTTGSNRVLRGGSWFYSAAACRSASRIGSLPNNGGDYFGFRVVFPVVHP